MVKVKICGLTRVEDIEAVNPLTVKPEYIGIVFAPSRRRVTPELALQLRRRLSPDIVPVGVFADESEEYMRGLVNNGVIDVIQTSSRMGEFLLFDSPVPGSGRTFDWSSIPEVNTPFFLAGGLSPENVADAVRRVKPFGVDVSSGVETLGVKDADKIKAFIKNAKNANLC